MKIALYIENGLEQIVLTPETDTEKGIVGKLHDKETELLIEQGSFYRCQGGWVRHGSMVYDSTGAYAEQARDKSTIIVLTRKKEDTG